MKQEFVSMDPVQLIKDLDHFGLDFQPRGKDIHVLVVASGGMTQSVDSSKKWLTPVEDLKDYMSNNPFLFDLALRENGWLDGTSDAN
ncbi:hypothetical protein DVH05_022335 [Phytophthora capsici]|nr:hypothetical protein DVH05_022335 [Phytophthora capsici]